MRASNSDQSTACSPLYKLSLWCRSDTGAVYTASPAESGPRSVMPTNIGTMSAPSWVRSAGFLTRRPTIPHMGWLLKKTRLEKFQIAARFPIGHVARILRPFHALQANELTRQIHPQTIADQRVRLERVDGFVQRLRQQLDALRRQFFRGQLVQVDVLRRTG